MSFLTPLFLAGLAGLAIPVLLHLIQRERRNVVPFPSLMFIRRIPYQSVRRRRVRHWLLLAMRLAALALLVLAFGRPFFRSTDAATAAGSGAREIVVLLDRSYSMGYGDRWNQALAAARQAVGGLTAEDRGSVVLFGSAAEVALRSTADRGRLEAAAAGVEPGASATRYGPALKLAGSILSESPRPRREAILISDFQRSGWQGAEGVRLPDGAVLTPVSLAAQGPNLSVTPVSLQRTMFSNQERVTVTAGVVNHGTAPVQNAELTLEIGGRGVQTQRVAVVPGGSASVSFDPVTVTAANTKASVRLAEDALERDNVFHFVLSPQQPVRVTVAERGGAAASSLYLSRALAVGEAPRFEAVSRPADALTADDLSRSSVIVLNDAAIGATLVARLRRFVEGGGGLLVVAAERSAWSGPTDILPGTPGEAVDRTGGAARLGGLEYGHPVFEVFRAPRSGDFAAARFYGYRSVTPAEGAQVLARYDDGKPALLEKKLGAGRVMLWTSSVDTYWNDLPIKPVFLPMVHRIVQYLADFHEPPLWRTVGEVVEPPVPVRAAAASTANRVALTPSGQRVDLDGEGPDVLELSEQGFYEVRTQGRDSDPPVVVASNVDLAESDPAPMDPAELAAAAMGHAGGAAPVTGPTTPPSDDVQEGVQRIWWYLMFAALLLLAAETVVANRSTV